MLIAAGTLTTIKGIYYVYFGERLIANYECEKNNSSITNNNNLPLGWMVEIATNNNPAHCNK